jgi:hypothetical protein
MRRRGIFGLALFGQLFYFKQIAIEVLNKGEKAIPFEYAIQCDMPSFTLPDKRLNIFDFQTDMFETRPPTRRVGCNKYLCDEPIVSVDKHLTFAVDPKYLAGQVL